MVVELIKLDFRVRKVQFDVKMANFRRLIAKSMSKIVTRV